MTHNPTTRYRHRSAEVEARQWTGHNADQMRAFVGADFDEIDPEDRAENPDATAAVRESKHGTWRGLEPGDWVVKIGDEFYEESDADFAASFEPVPSPADQAAVYAEVAELVRSMAPEHPRNAAWVQDCHHIADRIAEAVPVLRRLADEAQQPETQAHPPYHRWYAETLDDVADEWAPGMRFTDHAEAMARYETVSRNHPTRKDGAPVKRRFVRETTSYTVEAEHTPAVVESGKEA